MISDNALATYEFFENSQGGDTGRRETEHRSFLQLWFTHNFLDTGQKGLWVSNKSRIGSEVNGAQGGNRTPVRGATILYAAFTPPRPFLFCDRKRKIIYYLLAYPYRFILCYK